MGGWKDISQRFPEAVEIRQIALLSNSAFEFQPEIWWEERGIVTHGIGRTHWSAWSRLEPESVDRFLRLAEKYPDQLQVRQIRAFSPGVFEISFPPEPTKEEKELETLLREAWSVIRWHCFGQCRTEGVDGLPTPAEVDAKIHVKLTGKPSDQERAGK